MWNNQHIYGVYQEQMFSVQHGTLQWRWRWQPLRMSTSKWLFPPSLSCCLLLAQCGWGAAMLGLTGCQPFSNEGGAAGFLLFSFPSCYVLIVARMRSVLLVHRMTYLLAVNHASPRTSSAGWTGSSDSHKVQCCRCSFAGWLLQMSHLYLTLHLCCFNISWANGV